LIGLFCEEILPPNTVLFVAVTPFPFTLPVTEPPERLTLPFEEVMFPPNIVPLVAVTPLPPLTLPATEPLETLMEPFVEVTLPPKIVPLVEVTPLLPFTLPVILLPLRVIEFVVEIAPITVVLLREIGAPPLTLP